MWVVRYGTLHPTHINSPLSCDLLRLDIFLVIFRDNVIQELEEILEIFKLSVLILVEIFQLCLVLFGECRIKPCESIVCGSIANRPTLIGELVMLLGKTKGPYRAQIVHEQLQRAQLIIVYFLWEVQLPEKLT